MSAYKQARHYKIDDYRPQPLDQDALLDLVKNPDEYRQYVDALMLLQEFIREFSPAQNRPRLDRTEIETSLQRLQTQLPTLAAKNITENYRLAQKIEREGNIRYRDNNNSLNQQHAALFSDGLLEIYMLTTTLRQGIDLKRM